jgi:hypothetical protein
VKITITQRPLRIPQVVSNGILENHVLAKVYNRLLAVHPSVNHPGAGVWTVTWAPTGQGVVELPSEGEAECFVLELLKDIEQNKVLVIAAGRAQSVDVAALTRFCTFWGERRKLALPKYLAKTTMPEGLVIPGWHKREDK